MFKFADLYYLRRISWRIRHGRERNLPLALPYIFQSQWSIEGRNSFAIRESEVSLSCCINFLCLYCDEKDCSIQLSKETIISIGDYFADIIVDIIIYT